LGGRRKFPDDTSADAAKRIRLPLNPPRFRRHRDFLLPAQVSERIPICWRRPVLAGTGTAVRSIAIIYKQDYSAEEITAELPVTLAQVYAALT
jgi:uncharacterized protein (DUF433 family)